MVAVVENWSAVTGGVVALRSDDVREGYVRVAIAIAAADEVPGYPNLLGWAAGKTVDVLAQAGQTAGLTVGQRVGCRVRKASPSDAFVGPDGFTVLG